MDQREAVSLTVACYIGAARARGDDGPRPECGPRSHEGSEVLPLDIGPILDHLGV